jgi:citrate synthase
MHGELPNATQLAGWQHSVTTHTFVHEFLKRALEGYRYDAHPMGRLVAFLATLSTFYTDAKDIRDPDIRKQHAVRIIAKMPTIAAWAYRHSLGRPYVYPDNSLSYPGNFLAMMFQIAEPNYTPRSTARCTAAPTRPSCGCCERSATSRPSPSSSSR